MTDYSQNTVAGRILSDLGQQDPSEEVSGADLDYVLERLTQTLEEMLEDGAIDWDITGDIPGSRVNAVIQLMTGVLAPAYGVQVPVNPMTGKAVDEDMGRRRLRRYAQGEFVPPDWHRARNF